MKAYILVITLAASSLFGEVISGVDRFFDEKLYEQFHNKNIGLYTNHTGMDREGNLTVDRCLEHPKVRLIAIFSPEHGLDGVEPAAKNVSGFTYRGCTVHSLHGKYKRPLKSMLSKVDVIICDIQDIGCRSYTYASTLCYLIEAAAKKHIPIYILDRPNPMGGKLVDGPILSNKSRSIVGYVNVPYCHGMTLGELALYFNKEYSVGADVQVIKMKNWTRSATFEDTGLLWASPSPNIPESDSPFYYATTGIIGELPLVDIGIGSALPFKIIAAPWINQKQFQKDLNKQNLKGVKFIQYQYRPSRGPFANQLCKGVKICITDPQTYHPVKTGGLIISILKSSYPKEFSTDTITEKRKTMICKVIGDQTFTKAFLTQKNFGWSLATYFSKEAKKFLKKRKPFLLYKD